MDPWNVIKMYVCILFLYFNSDKQDFYYDYESYHIKSEHECMKIMFFQHHQVNNQILGSKSDLYYTEL
jgi:hypothetical protein